MNNPFEAPKANINTTSGQSDVAKCPSCGQQDAKAISYTWWGGALGPKMFKQVRCNGCNTDYNKETGKDLKGPIRIYLAVSTVIGLIIGYAFIQMR